VEIEGDENVQQRERAFYSRETTTALYPRLVVSYTVVNDTQAPQVTVDPLPAYSPREFTVTWSGADLGPAGISYYDVQYQIDGGGWVNWHTTVTFTSTTFVGANNRLYAFRARAVDNIGNVEAFGPAEAATTVDNVAPDVTVDPLPQEVTGVPITITWSGEDSVSGIEYYDVRYRFNGGTWIEWQNQTLSTAAEFVAMADGLYEFEARGTDNAGLVEQFTGLPEASTRRDVEAPFVEPRLWLPALLRTASPG
jgi:hypothetical protein